MNPKSKAYFLVAAMLLGGASLGAACSKGQGATAAESAYTLELLRCVDDASTLTDSKACRRRVDAHWGITETVTEAGGR